MAAKKTLAPRAGRPDPEALRRLADGFPPAAIRREEPAADKAPSPPPPVEEPAPVVPDLPAAEEPAPPAAEDAPSPPPPVVEQPAEPVLPPSPPPDAGKPAPREKPKPAVMQVNPRMDDALARGVAIEATMRGMRMNALVAEALEAYGIRPFRPGDPMPEVPPERVSAEVPEGTQVRQLNIRLSTDLGRGLQVCATLRGVTMSHLVIEALLHFGIRRVPV